MKTDLKEPGHCSCTASSQTNWVSQIDVFEKPQHPNTLPTPTLQKPPPPLFVFIMTSVALFTLTSNSAKAAAKISEDSGLPYWSSLSNKGHHRASLDVGEFPKSSKVWNCLRNVLLGDQFWEGGFHWKYIKSLLCLTSRVPPQQAQGHPTR